MPGKGKLDTQRRPVVTMDDAYDRTMTDPWDGLDELDALTWHRYAVDMVVTNAVTGTLPLQDMDGVMALDRDSTLLLITALISLGSALAGRLAAEHGTTPERLLSLARDDAS